jgi:hypothetical protein
MPEFWESKWGASTSGGFLYVELFYFQFQRGPRNSEFSSGTSEPGNLSVTFCKRRLDEFFLRIERLL